jgi:hypothetical protein
MENWQLIIVVLASVLTGALLLIVIILSITLYRVSKEVADVSKRLAPTLIQIQTITDRVEAISRGFNIPSAVLSAVGPAISAFMQTMHRDDASNGK